MQQDCPRVRELRSRWGGTEYKTPQTKLPHPIEPLKHEKNTEKLRKWSSFLTIFVIFQFFFLVCWGSQPERGILHIFRIFFRISGLEGFLYSVPPQEDLNQRAPNTKLRISTAHERPPKSKNKGQVKKKLLRSFPVPQNAAKQGKTELPRRRQTS